MATAGGPAKRERENVKMIGGAGEERRRELRQKKKTKKKMRRGWSAHLVHDCLQPHDL